LENNLITFGEIMTRFSPSNNLRISQSMPGSLEVTFAGCEASVAVSYSILGGESSFVTALPKNSISDACISNLKSFGVKTDKIIKTDSGRLGSYYLETGSNQRASKVEYDRSGSSIAILNPKTYNWNTILQNKTWLHISGITPALSEYAFEATLQAVKIAKSLGLQISLDLNYRSKLWKWDKNASSLKLARIKMPHILKYVNVLIGNEKDAEDVLNIEIPEANFEKGEINIDEYPKIAEKINHKYPNIKLIAITLRESVSANHNRWGAMIYDASKKSSFFSPKKNNKYMPYEITNIVDRLGAGDSFAAALIFSINHLNLKNSKALDFAVAASCIAHSIQGDYNITSINEIEKLAEGFTSGRVSR
tara:strand:- start:273 stop:1364 length:1092 start_codon:yes stop_codon:yes gene_type:complete